MHFLLREEREPDLLAVFILRALNLASLQLQWHRHVKSTNLHRE